MILFIAYCLFVGHSLLRELLRKTRNEKSAMHDPSSRLLISYAVFVVLSPLLAKLAVLNIGSMWVRLLGLAVMVCGLEVHLLAMRALGHHYTGNLQTIAGHRLIVTGPYRVVRNPGYFGNLLLGLGFGIATGNWLSLFCITVFFGIAYAFRMNVEEKMLRTKFGKQYDAYAKRTKKLIPFIY